ncbi:MAG: RDD family protein [Aureispira sp.]
MNLLDDNSLEREETIKAIYSSKGARFGAAFIDNLIITLLIFILGLFLGGGDSIGVNLANALLFPFYKILMEGSGGQTIGKKLLNIKVVRDDGSFTPLTMSDANRRFLLWWPMYVGLLFLTIAQMQLRADSFLIILIAIVMLLGCFLSIGSALSIFAGKRGKTWHDKIGKTICVKADSLNRW